jgi:hypothetical protein
MRKEGRASNTSANSVVHATSPCTVGNARRDGGATRIGFEADFDVAISEPLALAIADLVRVELDRRTEGDAA